MDQQLKYVKLSTGDELLTILEKPEGGLFHFKHPIKISHILDEEGGDGVRFTKWIPFTEDNLVPVSAKYIVTITSLSKKMSDIYNDILEEVNNMEEFTSEESLKDIMFN
jgi:hypothetical protein|tara:strand:- start:921 stop:1247 length:327 start_codon:yes stop_codon:yes gene_type:complete